MKIKNIFKYEPKLAKKLKEYEQKEKAEQQKSKVQNTSADKSNN
jgi:DICT domain-containing protein